MANRTFILLIVCLVLVVGIVIAGISRGWLGNDDVIARREAATSSDDDSKSSAASDSKRQSKTRSLSEALGISGDDIVKVGGIERPARDVATHSAKLARKPPKNPLPSAGKLPALKGNENPEVAGLFAELSDPDGPKEARSAVFLPQEFDKDRYLENPQEYLGSIRPGRVFKPANPGPGVVPIAAKSPRYVSLLQGEKAILQVSAAEKSPVTFYVVDGGEFSNRLKTISVAANENGIAEAVYTAVPGTRGVIDVLAASPLHSGQVRFAVKVAVPDN